MTTTPSCTDDLTARIEQRLADRLGPRKFAMWFERTAQIDLQDHDPRLRVFVPSRFVADWVQRHFINDLRLAAHEALRHEGRDIAPDDVHVELAVDAQRFDHDDVRRSAASRAEPAPFRSVDAVNGHRHPSARDTRHPRHGNAAPAPASASPGVPGLRPLRLRHRFDDFVTGPSNELAYAAAQQLAAEDDPGHPVFLHGGCGLGKTHLLQATCQAFRDRDPAAKVLYTTGEQFTNAYITAVRGNKLDAFRRAVRSLDLLAVDDVHFIANKQATQQEFLHSFEQIELTGSRLVLASDQHPKAIEQFSEGLVSRCVRGLVVQVHAPDGETRRRLVRSLIKRRGLLVTDVVVDLLAQKWTGSIRELEGMLAKLQAIASLHHGRATAPIGRAIVDQLFQSDQPARTRTVPRFDAILDAVIEVTGVTREAILGRGRQAQVVLARSLLIYITRALTAMSYPELAAAMGKRNHSTVITADQRMHRQLASQHTVTMPATDGPLTPRELHDRIRRHLGQPA